jgi:hypothetical protein
MTQLVIDIVAAVLIGIILVLIGVIFKQGGRRNDDSFVAGCDYQRKKDADIAAYWRCNGIPRLGVAKAILEGAKVEVVYSAAQTFATEGDMYEAIRRRNAAVVASGEYKEKK